MHNIARTIMVKLETPTANYHLAMVFPSTPPSTLPPLSFSSLTAFVIIKPTKPGRRKNRLLKDGLECLFRLINPLPSLKNKHLSITRSFSPKLPPVVVNGPPPDYDFRNATYHSTRELILRSHPELLDLVEEGTLVVVPRPPDYVERRSDGYEEPKLVYLVGTSHVSKKSVEDVERVIKAIKPENVVVELCRSRAAAMYSDKITEVPDKPTNGSNKVVNFMSLSGGNFSSAILRTLELGGRSALLLRLMLGQISNKISSDGQFGAEFLSARLAAEEINAQIVLGDRPIEITLKRAWKMLSWEEKLRLFFALFLGAGKKINSDEFASSVKDDDFLSAIFAQMSSKFPSLMQPLVYERDMYLAWSLKRSKAVNGCHRVVGVIGRGHLKGVFYALGHNDDSLRFKDLVGNRGASVGVDKVWDVSRQLLVDASIAWALWFIFDNWIYS